MGFFGFGITFSMGTIASWAQKTGMPLAVAFGVALLMYSWLIVKFPPRPLYQITEQANFYPS